MKEAPMHVVIIPTVYLLPAIAALIEAGCSFTCEPSPRYRNSQLPADSWRLGLSEDGIAVVNARDAALAARRSADAKRGEAGGEG
jgi:hypothetical protein